MSRASSTSVAAVALLSSLGFSPAGIAASAPQLLGPALLYQDSVILQETGEDFVAAPTGMLPGPDESFLIPDLFANRVFHFDVNGELVRAFGRQGQGPGEFTRVVDVGFASDSVFVVLDALALELEVFDFHTGEHIGAVGIEAEERLTSMSLVGDSVWFAGMNSEGWKAVGVVSVDELLAMAHQGAEAKRVSFLDRVDVPGVYVMNPRMFGRLGRTVLDVGASDFLVGFAGTAILMRFVQGAVADTLWLAHRLRRGPPRSDSWGSQGPMDLQFVNEISVMGLVSRDDDGNVITVHQESGIDGRQLANVKLYVATAARDGSLQCPDTLIPTSGIGVPRARLSGRQLFVLDQRMRAGPGADAVRNVTTVVRRFTVDPLKCTGQVVRHSSPDR
ncbi:MAG: hypothetical protein F4X15_09135 [Gemmatimonadetes bacterium]|nr:hypothetical protein [Gemmatimonadota bacterium]MYC91620.1 hypothetical protein [Gemmatimonadota bacterium]